MAVVNHHCLEYLVDYGLFIRENYTNHLLVLCSTFLKGKIYCELVIVISSFVSPATKVAESENMYCISVSNSNVDNVKFLCLDQFLLYHTT